jgi:hypothetical protein
MRTLHLAKFFKMHCVHAVMTDGFFRFGKESIGRGRILADVSTRSCDAGASLNTANKRELMET